MVDLVLQSWLNHLFKLTFLHCFIAFFIWVVIAIVLTLYGLPLLQSRISEIDILEGNASSSLLAPGVQSQIYYGILILSQPYGLCLLRHPAVPGCTTGHTFCVKLDGPSLRPWWPILLHHGYIIEALKVTLHMLIILHDPAVDLDPLFELHSFPTDQLLFTLAAL